MVPLTYAGSFQSPSKRTKPFVRFGLASTRMVGFIILAILALLYIAQSSQGATKRIEVQSLRANAEELSVENEQLRLEALRLQSLDTISQSSDALQLEPVRDVEQLP